jgi:peptidoglycan biosynthesis protein MviN/MurJ (putative lipid II flippase)
VLIRAAGHFKQTQTAALIECLLNLILSIILVRFFGLIGVVIGTLVAALFFVVYQVFYFNKNIVFVPIKGILKQFGVDALISGTTIVVALQIHLFTGGLVSWLIQAIAVSCICLVVTLVYEIVFYKGNMKLAFGKLTNKFKNKAIKR